jgi:AbrB family looped-hinge helix DNA binding protein
MKTEVKLNKRNQVTIPIQIRRKYRLEGGDKIVFEKSGNGFILRFEKKMAAESVNLRVDRDK